MCSWIAAPHVATASCDTTIVRHDDEVTTGSSGLYDNRNVTIPVWHQGPVWQSCWAIVERALSTEEYLDIQPWPPIELLGQLVVHAALGRRGLLEEDTTGDVFERETDRFELDAWAKMELSNWIAADDTAILDTPLGSLGQEQGDRCRDALIVSSTVAWAVNVVSRATLPVPTDGQAESESLDWAPGPWTPVRNVIKSIRVRADDVLARERERWELLAWRSALFDDPEAIDLDRQALGEAIVEVAGQSLVETSVTDFIDAHGRSFGEMSPDDLTQIGHEAELRLRTLNWICGFGESPQTAPLFLDD
jgi:hypothetical protein